MIMDVNAAAGNFMDEVYPLRSEFSSERYLAHALQNSESAYRGTTIPEEEVDGLLSAPNTNYRPISKYYPSPSGGLEEVKHSFVSGPCAAEHRGTDVVYYLDDQKPRYLFGLVRFGLPASSVRLPLLGYAASAHGGAVEAVLDDVTGTVVRHCESLFMATASFTCKLRKPCPLNTTLLLKAQVVDGSVTKGGLSCTTTGTLYEPKTGVVIATAEAKMVDFFKLREKATMSAYAPA